MGSAPGIGSAVQPRRAGGRIVLRRLLAFGVDYAFVAAYLAVLLGISLVLLASPAGVGYAALWSGPVRGALMGFAVLTLPVVLYFALSESLAGCTIGKRVLGLRVVSAGGGRLSMPRSLARSAIKFLPWELAHFTIWHYVYGSSAPVGPPAWTYATLAAVYLLVGLYLATMVAGRAHRSVYDRVAGSQVELDQRRG